MSTKNRVGSEQGFDFSEPLVAGDLSLDRNPATLVVVEQNPTSTKFLTQHRAFGEDIVECLLLLAHPSGKTPQNKQPGLENERGLIPHGQ